jgi:hypothetical protein
VNIVDIGDSRILLRFAMENRLADTQIRVPKIKAGAGKLFGKYGGEKRANSGIPAFR